MLFRSVAVVVGAADAAVVVVVVVAVVVAAVVVAVVAVVAVAVVVVVVVAVVVVVVVVAFVVEIGRAACREKVESVDVGDCLEKHKILWSVSRVNMNERGYSE